MKIGRTCSDFVCRLARVIVAGWLCQALSIAAGVEERFPVLQIGAQTYRNVTVTTKARSYVFILHSTGMTNVKVAELSPELREKLGYAAEEGKAGKGSASAWAQQKLSKIEVPQIKQLQTAWLAQEAMANPNLLLVALGAVLVLYLFACYCCMLICKKTHNEPGILVWVPGLQLFPLLRAAGMSPAWFLAWLVPVLNVLAQIVWSVKIAQARGKSAWVGLWLLLPVANVLAFLYLAFSEDAPKKEERVVEIMTLEAA